VLSLPQFKILALAVMAASVQSCATHSADYVPRLPFPYVLVDGTRLEGWEVGEPTAQGDLSEITLRYTQPSAPQKVLHLVVRRGERFHGFVLQDITVRAETIGVPGGPIAGILVEECVFRSLDDSSSFILGDDEGTQYVQLPRSNT
jgi:hypothetical protein